MPEEDKNQAAVELGKLGGQKTAERGPEYYAEIQAQRTRRAGGRPKNPLKAAHEGTLEIGDEKIACAVLEDGTRVLSEREVTKVLGGKRGGSHWLRKRGGAELPVYVSAGNLVPFIANDLAMALKTPVLYQPKAGGIAHGLKAEDFPKILEVWLKARAAGALRSTQSHFATKAEILVRALAGVAIVALVDEATGHQAVRDKRALQEILDRFLRKELAAWAKRFPDEFYQQIFRLRGWQWKGMNVNRPQIVAHYTKDLVYDRLAPGILAELEARNPKGERGRRKGRHHQWLTEDVGHPALAQHLYAVIGLMRASSSWDQFYEMLQRAFPKKGETLFLPLAEARA
ncbi:MAG: P63C domain-containing protein [Acidobacteriota bacterium]|nr:P63C domain-containing protein [Acidobacteriota bacterium]